MAPRFPAGATSRQTLPQAADGRHVGVAATYGRDAQRLLEMGYAPLPIVPREKRPAVSDWSQVPVDPDQVARWSRAFPGHGIGLRCGHLVAIDIDVTDPDEADRIDGIVRDRLGETLVRVGRWPKRLRLYRTDVPFRKLRAGSVEILGLGQQLVAFGIHPGTGQPYHWPGGETPLDVPLDALPRVDAAGCAALLAEIAGAPDPLPVPATSVQTPLRRPRGSPLPTGRPVQDGHGRVVDGRDGWLSQVAFHVVSEAIAAGRPCDRDELSALTWERFCATADLARPAGHGAPYSPADAARKVADKLRLHDEGSWARHPSEGNLDPDAARDRLTALLEAACSRIEAWDGRSPGVRIGIRATVGLGKTQLARSALLRLRGRLLAAGRPARLLVFTPSHALAEEAAAAWRVDGLRIAVHRGYRGRDPVTGAPVCRDPAAVTAALDAGMPVQSSVCVSTDGRRCRFFDTCAKQRNRDEVAAADVVIAAYDALFTGLPLDPTTIGAMLIDEGCWSRAWEQIRCPGFVDHTGDAELAGLRRKAADIFDGTRGPVGRTALLEAGLTADLCRRAIAHETWRMVRPRLRPGMSKSDRKRESPRIRTRRTQQHACAVWAAMADLLDGDVEQDGRLVVRERNGTIELVVRRLRSLHSDLCDLPLIHLDATLRPEIAGAILPGLEVAGLAAAMPHMALTLVTGSFGKGALCPGTRTGRAEAGRRANRLADCIDYVRWQARRGGAMLVVTYKEIEAAFAGIPGVVTAHFNAVAGLDGWRDVRRIVIVGRPLPSDTDLDPLAAAFFGNVTTGGYQNTEGTVRKRDGTATCVPILVHQDPDAEVLRAAICDDELIQAIGRGRGVNRTADSPLEVHVLADVALPLLHDVVVAWEAVKPDLFQRMLLEGLAVDSPRDGAILHPDLFRSRASAEKGMQRLFGGQTPIRDTYREMSVKSAAYRRPGRGRSWQRVWWLDGNADDAKVRLEVALGALAEWKPEA